jgi:hypothetical protein
MKKTITFLATVAFSCCGIHSSFAQIQFTTGQPTLAPLLLSNQTESAEVSDALVQETVPNPFDFFTEQDASSSATGSTPSASVELSPSDEDPTSLPVGRHHQNRSIVETVIDHSTISAIPHAAMGPVFWNAPARTPNPVAEILLREECNVRGLWAGYPAQRAAECADMWNRINKPHGCKSCAHTAPQCNTCQPVRNRYTQQAQAEVCDPLATPPLTQCSSPQPTEWVAPQTAEALQIEQESNKVAFLPLPAMR